MVMLMLSTIGLIFILSKAISILWNPVIFITVFLREYLWKKKGDSLLEKYGPWAAVTGCTDGIGKQYAIQLAKRGFNLALISRYTNRLEDVAAQIEASYGVKTKIIEADFTQGERIYPQIEKELKTLDLGLLVNNVGLTYEYPMSFCELPMTSIWDMLHVNVVAMTVLTRMVLPHMVERGRGAVVFMSSTADLQPVPFMSVYASAKTYLRYFSTAIRNEYKTRGITVQHLYPAFVKTKMISFAKSLLQSDSIWVPGPEDYVKQAILTLGKVDDTTGYWCHGLGATAAKMVPESIRTKTSLNMFLKFRKEHLDEKKIGDK